MFSQFSAIILDDSNDKKLLKLINTELGINRVKKYPNSIEALEAIKEYKNINLIFIDYETTLSKTFEFVQSAKKTGNCKNSKFFLMSNESSQRFLSEAAKNGISAFILKPYKDKKLIDKANRLLPKIEDAKKNRVNLLGSVEARLRFKNQEIIGGIENISGEGCKISTLRFGRMGAEVYDTVTIRVDFEDEKLGINAEIVKIEQDRTKEKKAITTTFKFKKPDEENAMQFAKFWAYILKERQEV